MIYLACPFRHQDIQEQRKRCAAAHYTAAQLFLEGKQVFSPLTHNELLINIVNDTIPGETWMQFDLKILSFCTKLYVLQMPGWENSKGVQREIAFAIEKNIPVQKIAPPDERHYLPFIRRGQELPFS